MTEMEELEARVAALEAELVALAEARLAGRAALLAEVVDEQERTRALLAPGPRGTVFLNLLDEAGRLRAALGVIEGRPRLTLLDGEGRERLALELVEGGAPRVTFSDGAAARQISAGVDGGPVVAFYDGTGAPRSTLLVDPKGRGRIA